MKHENQMPMAALRCRASRNIVLISDSVDGAIVAPAIPRAPRATISIGADVE